VDIIIYKLRHARSLVFSDKVLAFSGDLSISEVHIWMCCRKLPANSLNHTHEKVVAEKLYSLPAGIFSSEEAPLPA
jgi:hypothetical protein